MGLPDNSDNCFDPAQLWSQVPQVWVHSKGQVIDFKNLFSMKIYISNLYTSVCTFTFPIYIHMCVCVCVCVCVWQGIPCQFFKTARSPKTRVFKRKSFSLFSQRSYSDSLHILPFSLKPYCDKTLSTLALFKKQKVSEEIPYVPTLLDLMDRTVW
jgi:hypothetical protein